MKVCFETFGCRLNRAEALQDEANFLSRGWVRTESHAEADLVVVRGCSVTARAERDCRKLISHLRAKYPNKRVSVVGCLKDRDDRPAVPDDPLALPQRTARAYLKVQDGCSGACTFCIVPQFRGASQSVPFEAVLDKARRFIASGYREIVVTGCNLGQYLHEGRRFPELLDALLRLAAEGAEPCRIRLGSLEPGPTALETVRTLAAHANACRFLHIPLQSGSNRILAAMRRPYLVRDVEALVNEAVRLMPNLGLGCDLMTGFPDETDMDFLATRAFLNRQPFSNAHVFPYSERPGTPAAKFGGVVPQEIRRERAHELADLAAHLRRRQARRFAGREVEMIVEDEKKPCGWTSEYFACKATGRAARKSCVRVRVTSVGSDGTLRGTIV